MTKPVEFAGVEFAPRHIEDVEPGVRFEYRRGYHIDAERNKQIPPLFRRADGFYHWHTDSCLVGFFILSRADAHMKAMALEDMLLTHPGSCALFGLTRGELTQLRIEADLKDSVKTVPTEAGLLNFV